MTIHTGFHKGTPVFVRLKSGERFVDKFVENKSTYLVLAVRGKVLTRDLKSITIRR